MLWSRAEVLQISAEGSIPSISTKFKTKFMGDYSTLEERAVLEAVKGGFDTRIAYHSIIKGVYMCFPGPTYEVEYDEDGEPIFLDDEEIEEEEE
jgi:hypothetical protein